MNDDTTKKETIENSPLNDLFEDESQASTRGDELLKAILQPYAYIGKDTKEVQFRDEAFNLQNKHRILLLFLAKLAQKRLGLLPDESISQKETIDFFSVHGIPEGTIKVTLKQLRDERLILKISEGRYGTSFDKLTRIREEFNKYGKKTN